MITFKSHAAQDLVMLKDLAVTLLSTIGKPLGERGVITVEELPQAIQKLEEAIQQAKKDSAEHAGYFHDFDADRSSIEEHDVPISFAQRAVPFLAMLKASQNEKCSVVWGV